MIYVKHVSTTMKKGCNVELGPRTVIVGPNGSGKSTVVQAIELSTRGQVSDLEGRDQVKQQAALARLFPSGVPMEAACRLSDGTLFSWAMEEKKGGGHKKPAFDPPKAVRFPVQDLKRVLGGDANSVAMWLESQVVGDLSEADILRLLPPEVREDVQALMARTRQTDFMALAKVAKSEARNLRTQATRSDNTVEKMTQGISPPLLDSERESLQSQLTALRAVHTSGVTQEVMTSWNERAGVLAEQYINKQEALSSVPQPGSEAERAFQAISKLERVQQIIQSHAREFHDDCWVCGREEVAHDLVAQAAKVSSLLTSFSSQVKGAVQYRMVEKEMAAILSELEALAVKIKSTSVIEDTREEQRQIQQKLAADDAAKRTWSNASAARRESAQLRARADRLTLASKALASSGKELLDSRKRAFESSVSSFLPDGEVLGVDLDASRVGILRGSELHSALSGAEWSRVLLALASVGLGGSTPCVLIPDDRAWDRDTLGRVMEALSASETQIIIMTTVAPDPVEGWTLLEL